VLWSVCSSLEKVPFYFCVGSDNYITGKHEHASALSPLLFVIVMLAISREFRVALPWELLYDDDFVAAATHCLLLQIFLKKRPLN